ncbi:TolC family protein [Aureibaculum marinum]|uniref:TolC family protein n=1 Tax=Aureibaculum marinum TaxID=2487930 RepID=A0A3N4NJX1_9FLAO|nr:TolC family protein [Aureibaculum marinum]RPD95815.1 TolC family protein [Aureibaculum marinum]
MYKLQIIIVCLLFSISGFSQEVPSSFSLQEAINFALKNNRAVKNANLDIEAAKKQKWETTAIGLPQINASIDYQNWLKQQVSLLPAAAFDNTQSVIEVVNDYFDANQTNFNVATPEGFIPLSFGTKQNMTATATLSQLIFDGSYLVGLQSAKVFLEISKNAKEKTDLEIRKAVINAYGNVLLAEESVNILEKNKTVLEKNLYEVTKLYENGLDEQESVEQLQITLSSIESNLNNANRLKTLAYQMLNITMGIDIYNNTTVTENLEDLTQQHITLALLEANNDVKNTVDFKIAANEKASKELLLKLEKSKALPTLTAFVNGGYNGNSETFSFADKNQQWYGSSLLGLSLNIPIFSSGMRSAATQRAKINLEKSKNDLTEIEQQLKLKLESAKSDYQFAIEEYNNKKQNLNLAERIEKKNQTKYFEGIGSSFELRQAQTQLYTAQQELLKSMLDVITKKAELETILNTTTEN